MDIREKLIELLYPIIGLRSWSERIADHLIANGVMVQEWIPMSEPLPEEGMPVLTFHDKYVEEYGNMVTAVRKDGNWYGCLGSTITHWSHLPPPPKGE